MSSARDFFALIWLTLLHPAVMASRIMKFSYDRRTLCMGVGLVSIMSVILVLVVGLTSPIVLPLGFSPIVYGLIMAFVLIMLALALHKTGLIFGGLATLSQTFAAVIWLEMTAFCVRSVQTIVSMISPNLADILSTVGLIALLRVLVSFVNEIHQFESFPRATTTIVIAILGIGIGFAFLLTMFGVTAQLEI